MKLEVIISSGASAKEQHKEHLNCMTVSAMDMTTMKMANS